MGWLRTAVGWVTVWVTRNWMFEDLTTRRTSATKWRSPYASGSRQRVGVAIRVIVHVDSPTPESETLATLYINVVS